MKTKTQLLALLVVLTTAAVPAATLPPGFSESVVASGLSNPTAMDFAPDGRLFVCQQAGQLRVIKNDVLLAAPFLTVTPDSTGERGLLGVTFDPDFVNNQWVYIYYTVPGSPAHNRVSRFTASGDVAVSGSEMMVLELDNLSNASNHNGGAIHFGSDGQLYVAVGENANPTNAQTLGNRLGKMLRINADGTIPTDNPFYGVASGANCASCSTQARCRTPSSSPPARSVRCLRFVFPRPPVRRVGQDVSANCSFKRTDHGRHPAKHPLPHDTRLLRRARSPDASGRSAGLSARASG